MLLVAGWATAGAARAAGESPAANRGFDIIAADYTADVDPVTGAASGSLDVTLTVVTDDATGIGLALDAGLTIDEATSDAGTVTVKTIVASPLLIVQLVLDDAPAIGSQVLIHAAYSGQQQCNASDLRGHRACSFGADKPMTHLRRESVLPTFYDLADTADSYELYRRSLTLSVPSSVEAYASSDFVSRTANNDRAVWSWSSDVVHQIQDLVVVMGDLASLEVPDSDPPFAIVYDSNVTKWSTEMRDWAAKIVPFLDELTGSSLPFEQVDLVKLPNITGFPGTATSNLVLLSEAYGDQLGAGNFEQTLAHEVSHLWWGNVAFSDEPSYWLLEGLARWTELEYIAQVYDITDPGYDTHDYIGRSRWHALLMRYVLDNDGKAPLVVASWNAVPSSDVMQFTTWAYARGAATLDHLRIVVGREAFARGLKRWASDCAFKRCTSLDFRAILEAESGMDLTDFWAQHVLGSKFPDVAWTFSQTRKSASGDAVTVDVQYAQTPAANSHLDLWLEREDGVVERHKVDVTGTSGELALEAAGPVRRVRPNPLHDPIIWSRSGVDGDADFDGAVDGLDLVECAGWLILAFPPVGEATRLFDVNAINPLCDLDFDGIIDESDLELLSLAFGVVEPPIGDAP